MSKPAIKSLPLDDIRTNGGTQSRLQLNERRIQSYADDAREGAKFPPVVVFWDGFIYWLADGFHRIEAWRLLKRRSIMAEVREGTVRDAILQSVGANATHGLRRTNADKRNAVLTLLNDEEWGRKSDNWIAEQCGVSQPFVSGLRSEATYNGYESSTRMGQDGRTINTANIGRQNSQLEVVPGYPMDDEPPAPPYPKNDPYDEAVEGTPVWPDEPETDPDDEDGLAAWAEPENDPEPEAAPQSAPEDPPLVSSPAALPAPSPPPPSFEERARALPLYQALSGYGHAGHGFLSAATAWYALEEARGKFAFAHSRAVPRHATGAVFDEWRTMLRIPAPEWWEGCPACKGSLRIGDGERCGSCKGGFTTHPNEGVTPEVVRAFQAQVVATQEVSV